MSETTDRNPKDFWELCMMVDIIDVETSKGNEAPRSDLEVSTTY